MTKSSPPSSLPSQLSVSSSFTFVIDYDAFIFVSHHHSHHNYHCCGIEPEAQKPGWQGGIAIRKVFARRESFCASGKFSDSLDIFQIVWKVSEYPGKFPDSLKSFGIPGKYQNSLESFRIAWKVSG